MFDDLVISSVHPNKTHKPWTVFVSTVVQAAIVGFMILLPLIYTEALPKGLMNTFLVAPAPPPPPPPPAPVIKIVKPVVKLIQQGKLTSPTVIPKKVNVIKEAEEPPDVVGMVGGVPGGIAGGSGGGVLGGILGGAGSGPPPPPKPKGPQRIGGNVMMAMLIRQPMPVYPQIARPAHISGTVILHAIIGADGTVQNLEYISGPPLLMHAAMDAVRQWRYKPTMLNGEPTAVDTTVSVVFTLGG